MFCDAAYFLELFVFVVFCLNITAAEPIDEPFVKFVVDVDNTPVTISTHSSTEEVVRIANVKGQSYTCHVPLSAAAATYAAHEHNQTRALAAASAEISAVLAKLARRSSCLTHTSGWWTYELCVMQSVSQYHLEAGRTVSGAVISLGHFQSEFNWTTAAASGGATDQGAPRARQLRHRYHSQMYDGGSYCELVERPRSTEVRYWCGESALVGDTDAPAGLGSSSSSSLLSSLMADAGDRVVSVREPRSCHYVIDVHVQALCDVAALRPAVTPTPTVLQCHPLVAADELRALLTARVTALLSRMRVAAASVPSVARALGSWRQEWQRGGGRHVQPSAATMIKCELLAGCVTSLATSLVNVTGALQSPFRQSSAASQSLSGVLSKVSATLDTVRQRAHTVTSLITLHQKQQGRRRSANVNDDDDGDDEANDWAETTVVSLCECVDQVVSVVGALALPSVTAALQLHLAELSDNTALSHASMALAAAESPVLALAQQFSDADRLRRAVLAALIPPSKRGSAGESGQSGEARRSPGGNSGTSRAMSASERWRRLVAGSGGVDAALPAVGSLLRMRRVNSDQQHSVISALQQRLATVGLQVDTPQLNVRVLTRHNDGDEIGAVNSGGGGGSHEEHTLNGEELRALENVVVAMVLGGTGDHVISEHQEHRRLADNYLYDVHTHARALQETLPLSPSADGDGARAMKGSHQSAEWSGETEGPASSQPSSANAADQPPIAGALTRARRDDVSGDNAADPTVLILADGH